MKILLSIFILYGLLLSSELTTYSSCSVDSVIGKISRYARGSNLTIFNRISIDSGESLRVEFAEPQNGIVTFINPRVGERLIRADKSNPRDLSIGVRVVKESRDRVKVSYDDPYNLHSRDFSKYTNAKIADFANRVSKVIHRATKRACIGVKATF